MTFCFRPSMIFFRYDTGRFRPEVRGCCTRANDGTSHTQSSSTSTGRCCSRPRRTTRSYREAIRAILGPVRFRPDLHDYAHVSDSGLLAEVLDDNGIARDTGAERAIREAFFARMQSHIVEQGPFAEIPGATNFLKRLEKSSHHAIVIATGGWRRTAQLKLASAGFDIGRIPLATSDDAKERTDIMRIALDCLGGEFATITYFGDGRWDQAACRELGWSFRAVGPVLGGIDSYDGEFAMEPDA